MAGGRLQADPLFQGLARPPMIMGVSYMYFVANALIVMVMFINTKSFYSFPLGMVIHLFGYLLCMKEPRALELWILRMNYGYRSWNRIMPTKASRGFYFNTNSYDVF